MKSKKHQLFFNIRVEAEIKQFKPELNVKLEKKNNAKKSIDEYF